MPTRKRLTDEGCKRLKPPKDRPYVDHFDSLVPRLMLTCYRSRKKVWHLQYYPKRLAGRVTTRKLGTFPEMGVAAARKSARDFELDPEAAEAKTAVGSFGEIAEQFMKRHVEANGLRSKSDIERHIKYANKHWRDRPFLEIKRRDVADLLDKLEDERGAGVATAVLSTIRKMQNWFAARSDDYTSPIVPGMSRHNSQARKRILSDAELRQAWTACDELPIFGDFVRLLLLTAQRRAKVAEMKWDDVDLETGLWSIPSPVALEKGNGGNLLLPEQALKILARQPKIYGNPYVFPGRGGMYINGFNKRMAALRAKLPKDQRDWTLHDLRRTARSLMSRAGVRPEIAERTLGHAVGVLEATYDRHHYADEKADALNRLAALIDTILTPPTGNVIHIATAGRGA